MATLSPIRSEQIDAGAAAILQTLHEAGHQALLAGGCVRDLLLGKRPTDWDIASDAEPPRVRELFPRTYAIGERFGIIRVVTELGEYEVARFRREGSYSDGRHPDIVEFTDAEEDARRRDLTINALFYDPIAGEVVDFVDGRYDLVAQIVRAVGDPETRLRDDRLRVLRTIRFAARLDWQIETATWKAACALAPSADTVSAERVHEELTRILTEGGAATGAQLLMDSGLMAVLLPEVAALEGVPQPPEYHPEGDVWVHVKRMLFELDRATEATPELAWAVLLHDVGKPGTFSESDRIRFNGHDARGAEMVDAIGYRLRMSNARRERIRELTAQHMRFRNVRQMRESKLKRFLRSPLFPELLELHRIDCVGSHGALDLYEFCRDRLETMPDDPEGLVPPRLLSGVDLIEMGYATGPRFRRMLNWVEDAQLEGRIHSFEEARAEIQKHFPGEGERG